MKKKSNEEESPIFIEYDDNSLEQVLCGPNYGQPWNGDGLYNIEAWGLGSKDHVVQCSILRGSGTMLLVH